MFHLYVLKSVKTGRRNVGYCQQLEDRLHRHNTGQSKATRHGAPWILLHTEDVPSRSEAMKRERFYKTGRGREELDALENPERSPRRQVAGSNPVTPTTSMLGMKTFLLRVSLFTACLLFSEVRAQDEPLPSPEPKATGSATPAPIITPPPPIIPPELLALPDERNPHAPPCPRYRPSMKDSNPHR